MLCLIREFFLYKGEETSEDDKEFAKLEKRQQITGELEINGQRK